ncbi:caspase family protein [Gemmobacter caeruleus]|uniref:caspase family protein n=1 Tax=Gemmobacter caeruleus TaxID=2595004 RepID=UPI0011EF3DDB|nr:caspase family protein [Gemmobacter caeruleus]
MTRYPVRLWPVLLVALTCAQPLWAEGRRAVVIGNSAYPGAPLENPDRDARLMAQTLDELGFDVSLFLDVSSAQMPLLLDRVQEKLADAEVAVVYYAGHGLQFRDENLLLPVDTDFTSVAGIAGAGLPLSRMLGAATAGGGGVRLVILDACRNALAASAPEGELKSGFSFVEAPRGEVLIAFSTGAGEVAFDSAGGVNSPYTTALANALQQSGADLYDVFRSVRRAVRSGTGGQQIPWITGSIESSVVLRPALTRAAPVPADAAAGAVVRTQGGAVLTLDGVLWDYLQGSVNPDDFRRFAEVFPDSPHAPEARDRQGQTLARADAQSVSRDGVRLSPQEIVTEMGAASPDPGETGRASVLIDQSGSYVMRDSFRTWPLQLPATKAGLAASATDCDEEAADPVDPDKLSPGVSDANLNIRRALRACAFALAADPQNPRLLFQFGRVLDVARRHDWANAWYEAAIEGGYSAAMVNRGFNARMGRGGARDPDLSFALYTRAAQGGNLRGRTNLGNAFLLGEGVEKNPEEGVLWLRLAASMGWPHAVNALGDAYMNGTGVTATPEEAVALYRSAAEMGQTTAMANLGRAYLAGRGVAADAAQGLAWLDRARGMGNGFAPVYAGRFYLEGGGGIAADPPRARQLFEDATRRGNAIGYLELAEGHRKGAFGAPPDLEAALRNALFAEAGRVKQAAPLVEELAATLPADRVAAIRAEVKTFLDQNGL